MNNKCTYKETVGEQCACVQALSRNKLEHTHMQGRRNASYMDGLKISNDLLTIPSTDPVPNLGTFIWNLLGEKK